MKITDVKALAVKGRHWPRFPMVFVEVYTDEGLVGVGEALAFQATGVRQSVEEIGEWLRGEDALQIERLWERCFRRGAGMAALSGIEIALWDIAGQVAGMPIYQLLGGACHDRVRVYADGFFRGADPTPEAYGEKAEAAVAKGLTALKLDIDDFLYLGGERKALIRCHGADLGRHITNAEIRKVAASVAAIRERLGPEIDLALDCHWAFDVPSASRLGRALEPYDLMWLEDPTPSKSTPALAKLARELPMPLCLGEALATRFEFREILEKQAASVIMPDVASSGGILEMKKIAALADTYYVPMAPHDMVGPIATAATVQLCYSIPNLLIMEHQLTDVPWRHELTDEPLLVKDGYYELPTRPGVGMKLNHEAVARYRAE
ncbi:MAG TPA: mandelate racemase/muconate lactonizing enzyme family protein [Tepidisphaeraceae bacterium]|nr:mandelate racemase/muconate lactonizing enzyme family protein [Tepidisphaeraceae bacterium]